MKSVNTERNHFSHVIAWDTLFCIVYYIITRVEWNMFEWQLCIDPPERTAACLSPAVGPGVRQQLNLSAGEGKGGREDK